MFTQSGYEKETCIYSLTCLRVVLSDICTQTTKDKESIVSIAEAVTFDL